MADTRFRELFDDLLEGFQLIDFEGRYTYVNRAVVQQLRKPKEALLGERIADVFPKFSKSDAYKAITRCARDRCSEQLEAMFEYEDGSTAWFDLRIEPAAEGVAVLSIDVSARKRAEQSVETITHALQESEQRFRIAFEASPIAKVLIRIADRRIVEVNSAYLRLFGFSREEVLAPRPEDLPLISEKTELAQFWRRVDEGGRMTEIDFHFTTRDGQPGEASAFAERFSLGGEDFVLVGVQDLTERRDAERALRESDERFRQLADTIQEVFWLTDAGKANIVYVSPGYETIWGRTCAELYANPSAWLDAIQPDERERVRTAALEKQVLGTYDEQYRVVRPDGEVRWIHDRGFPVRDASGKVIRIAGTARDVTEEKELESRLQQSQKLESIGALAGGIAHDFNNWLTVISGNADLLLRMLPEDPDMHDVLGEIRHAGERAAALTRQLLAFSRQEVVTLRVVELDTIILDIEKMLRRVLGEDIHLVTTLAPEPCRVKVDSGSFVQVLMNLAVNARDAMPRGGKLMITTDRVVLDADAVAGTKLQAGPHARLTVADTGSGMPAHVRARIFEPFFTTKGVGRGTGLGLAVVHGIVARSGGHIEVETAPGTGTTFRIFLPIVEPAPAATNAATGRAGLASGTETILLVEDEAALRKIALRALTACGYTVHAAADGEEAQNIVNELAQPIDLLVTDVVMPRVGGRQLAEALRARFPTIRVLYTSGYTDDAVVRHGVMHAEVAFLPKPYTLPDLRQKVREVLDSR